MSALLLHNWGLSMQMAKRSPGAAFIVPSVVHWKLGHYAAIVAAKGGRYEIHDPTFGGMHFVVSEAALKQEVQWVLSRSVRPPSFRLVFRY